MPPTRRLTVLDASQPRPLPSQAGSGPVVFRHSSPGVPESNGTSQLSTDTAPTRPSHRLGKIPANRPLSARGEIRQGRTTLTRGLSRGERVAVYDAWDQAHDWTTRWLNDHPTGRTRKRPTRSLRSRVTATSPQKSTFASGRRSAPSTAPASRPTSTPSTASSSTASARPDPASSTPPSPAPRHSPTNPPTRSSPR
jgi:hypothetical protein